MKIEYQKKRFKYIRLTSHWNSGCKCTENMAVKGSPLQGVEQCRDMWTRPEVVRVERDTDTPSQGDYMMRGGNIIQPDAISSREFHD